MYDTGMDRRMDSLATVLPAMNLVPVEGAGVSSFEQEIIVSRAAGTIRVMNRPFAFIRQEYWFIFPETYPGAICYAGGCSFFLKMRDRLTLNAL